MFLVTGDFEDILGPHATVIPNDTKIYLYSHLAGEFFYTEILNFTSGKLEELAHQA